MYGALLQRESPRADTHVTSSNAIAASSPLGSPVGVETAAAAARRRSTNAFVPVVCSIFGVIIFMRLGLIVGVVGLWRAWLLVVLAFGITFLSIGSLSALASSQHGGFYDAILRAAGDHAGRAIGMLLFVAFSVASAYYLLGFAEITAFYLSVELTHYALPWNASGSYVTVAIASVMLAMLTVGFAAGAMRIRKTLLGVVFVVMMLAIACSVLFLVVRNATISTSGATPVLHGNLGGHAPRRVVEMFGEFFPAFCGVLAGIHLADQLAVRPATGGRPSIGSAHLIVGAHKALVFCGAIYCALTLVLAACVENDNLRNERFVVQLAVDSILGIPIVYLGVIATTLTSALSNILGAASMYESARSIVDDVPTSPNQPLVNHRVASSGRGPSQSVTGFLLAWAVCQTAIACGSVDSIIPMVSSTFLFTLAVVNFACFYHELMSPAFTTSFIMYSKWSALVGFCLCISALFLVMSPFFVGCMVAGVAGALVYFQRAIPEFIVSIRRQDPKDDKQDRTTPSNSFTTDRAIELERIPSLDETLPRSEFEKLANGDLGHTKRIEMAALYVRDALHGRFLGEEYVSEGLHKLQYKRWYHALQFARMGNMAVLLGLSFFEVPSWCFYTLECGDSRYTLMWGLPILSREVTLTIELVNLAVLAIESALKFQYLGKRLYFANKWHIVQMILMLSDSISLVLVAVVLQQPSVSDSQDQFTPIILSPVIRPLLLLTMSERLRSGFLSLLRVLPRVMDGLLIVLVLIVIYSVSGMVMFEGTEEGRQYFPDFPTAWLNMVVLLTTANFPDVMMPAYARTRYTGLFFMTFLMIGLLVMMNLVFASIYQNYRQQVSQRAIDFAERRNRSLEFAFQLLPGEYCDAQGHRIKTISRDTYEALVGELLRPIVSFFEWSSPSTTHDRRADVLKSVDSTKSEITVTKFISKIKAFAARQKVQRTKRPSAPRFRSSSSLVSVVSDVVRSDKFEYFIDAIILGNLIAILLEIQAKIDQRIEDYMRWERFMPLFSCVYLAEMALKIYVNRWRVYFKSMKNCYDCTVTVIIVVAEVSVQVHYTEGMSWQWIQILLLLRYLRCLRLVVALQPLSSMFSMVLQLLPTFTTLYGMLGIVMMEYAAIGVEIFGGKIRVDDSRLDQSNFAKANYYANNFNDFPSAMTTLFELLLVNNWHVIMEGVELVTTKWSRVYFISFYVIGVIMMLNLVIAFVVEAYLEQASTLDSEDTPQLSQMQRGGSSSGLLSLPADSDTPSTGDLDDPSSLSIDEKQLLHRRSQVVTRSRGHSVNIGDFL